MARREPDAGSRSGAVVRHVEGVRELVRLDAPLKRLNPWYGEYMSNSS